MPYKFNPFTNNLDYYEPGIDTPGYNIDGGSAYILIDGGSASSVYSTYALSVPIDLDGGVA